MLVLEVLTQQQEDVRKATRLQEACKGRWVDALLDGCTVDRRGTTAAGRHPYHSILSIRRGMHHVGKVHVKRAPKKLHTKQSTQVVQPAGKVPRAGLHCAAATCIGLLD